jgi:hypothetical protein
VLLGTDSLLDEPQGSRFELGPVALKRVLILLEEIGWNGIQGA